MQKLPCVYIMTNRPHGTLYVGVTSDITRREFRHRNLAVKGFSSKYLLKLLVFYERHECMYEAIQREKHIKWWKRAWKIRLIEELNPDWKDLFDEVCC